MADKKTKSKSTTDKIKEELDILVEITTEMQRQLDKGDCKLLGFKEAADYLGCSHSFLYKLTAANLIPCYKPRGRLYFFQHDISKWVMEGKNNKFINITTEEENEGSTN